MSSPLRFVFSVILRKPPILPTPVNFASFFCLALFLSFFAAEIAQADDLRITSPAENTTFSYSLALIHGELDDKEATEVRLVNPRVHNGDEAVPGQAYQGRFKVLAPLRKGENVLTVRCGKAEAVVKLNFVPNANPKFVRVVYLTDSSGNTTFQTPDGKGSDDYRRRLALAMKLMQTLTAERMHDLGYGYRTYNIELDENDEVVVHTLPGEKTAEDYYVLYDENRFFGQIYGEIDRAFPDDNRVLVITAFTRWDPERRKAKGHTAVGGGRLAVFGGGTLYCWPTALDTFLSDMLDTTPVDTNKVMDDSVGRSVNWACAATCIGASLHEIGHTMDLPHTDDWTDIMTRGHDHFYRVFLVREAPSAHTEHKRWTDFTQDQMARFAPPSAGSLIVSRWFAEDDPSDRKKADISVNVDLAGETVRITAENGIACVQAVADDGRIVFFTAPKPEQALRGEFPRTEELSFETLRKITKQDHIRIRVGDAKGFFGRQRDVRLAFEEPAPGKQTPCIPEFDKDLPKDKQPLAYWIFLPKDYRSEVGGDAKGDTKGNEKSGWPLLLFLHGSGECGLDIDAVRVHGPPKILGDPEKARDWPFITVSPQNPVSRDWSTEPLITLLDKITKEYRVDPSRIYVTGLGMGGTATWRLLHDHGDRFAAGIPICAVGDAKSTEPYLEKPIWVFHGAKDNFINPQFSKDMVEAIKAAGGKKIRFTLYPDVGHFSWVPTYDNPEIYRWLLSQRRDGEKP